MRSIDAAVNGSTKEAPDRVKNAAVIGSKEARRDWSRKPPADSSKKPPADSSRKPPADSFKPGLFLHLPLRNSAPLVKCPTSAGWPTSTIALMFALSMLRTLVCFKAHG